MRCVYESKLHKDNSFITLTYSDKFLPGGGSLLKSDFQCFIKKLRKRFIDTHFFVDEDGRKHSSIRYFHCGEYGDRLSRPHYHALLFGIDFPDRRLIRDGDFPLFQSDVLDSLWGKGFASIGDLTFESAAYTARYCMKKITGQAAEAHYTRLIPETGELVQLLPEYTSMSLKPGIGAGWFTKFASDVFPSDFLIVNGQRVRPPKFFDRLHEVDFPEQLEAIKLKRVRHASKFKADGTPERLEVRERVARARLLLSKRSMEVL